MTTDSLAAALAELQTHLPQIRKDQTGKVEGTTKEGKAFSYTYSYADLSGISEAIMPLLGKLGLSFIAKPTLNSEGKFVLAYALLHESGEREDGAYPLTGSTPQQIGSAITYGRRYCLCAITGVAPEDDDDGARAAGAQAEEASTELLDAKDAVRGAWTVTFGAFDADEASKYYDRWQGKKAASLRQAGAAELRRFAAMLHALPVADAGSNPNTHPVNGEPPMTDDPAIINTPRAMTHGQRARIFASLSDLGVKDDQDQRDYLGEVLGRTVASRGSITFAEAKTLIDHFTELRPPVAPEEGQ
jgi:hypothetical protein